MLSSLLLRTVLPSSRADFTGPCHMRGGNGLGSYMMLWVSVSESALSHDIQPFECSGSDLLPGIRAGLVRACESKRFS